MAEPARDDAPAPGPGQPAGEPDPQARVRASVLHLIATAADAAAQSAAELTERPDCARALRRAEIIRDALADLAGIARGLAEIDRGRVVDEAVLAAREQAAYKQGLADGKAGRGCLRALPSPGVYY